MEKLEAKKRMKVDIFEYISQNQVVEALISSDAVKLQEIKDLKSELDIINNRMIATVDAASEIELLRIIAAFTYPIKSLDL